MQILQNQQNYRNVNKVKYRTNTRYAKSRIYSCSSTWINLSEWHSVMSAMPRWKRLTILQKKRTILHKQKPFYIFAYETIFRFNLEMLKDEEEEKHEEKNCRNDARIWIVSILWNVGTQKNHSSVLEHKKQGKTSKHIHVHTCKHGRTHSFFMPNVNFHTLQQPHSFNGRIIFHIIYYNRAHFKQTIKIPCRYGCVWMEKWRAYDMHGGCGCGLILPPFIGELEWERWDYFFQQTSTYINLCIFFLW